VVDLGSLQGKYLEVESSGMSPQGHPILRGVHAVLGRRVTIRLLPHLSAEGSRQQETLFRRGARAAAGLHHQNIIQILDYETTPTANLLITEFVEGESLDEILKREGPLPLERVFQIAWQLSEALDAAHQANRIHRNLKPTEIFLTPRGQVKLGGFEAAVFPEDTDRFATDPYLGNAFYMSPEQVQGQPVTALADLYALGVLLYLMLTGQPPFTGSRSWAILYKKTTSDPPPPSQVRPGLPSGLDDLVLRLLRRLPEERFPTTRDFREALARLAEPPANESGKVEEVIARTYPFPIAMTYVLVWQELEWVNRLHRLLYLFEATLKYCSSLALLAALRAGQGRPAPEDLATLRRPSLGHWAGYLRLAVNLADPPAPGLQEKLAQFYRGGPPLPGRGLDLIDYGVQLRNRFAHGATVKEAVHRQAFEDLLPHVNSLLQRLDFLPDFPLGKIHRLQFTGKGFVAAYRSYMGALPVFPAAEALLSEPVMDNAFGIFDPSGTAFLDLTPLLRAAECRVCGDEEVFYYNGMKGKKKLDFLSYQKGHVFEEELPGDPFAERGISL
jgi:Protein kinase domain